MSNDDLGRGLSPDIIYLDVEQEAVGPGIPGYKSFYLDVSGKQVEYFRKRWDDQQFYKLDLTDYAAPKLIRDYQVFLEPEAQLTGTSHVPEGYYLKNRWLPPQDAIIPKDAEGVVVGKYGDRTVRLLKGLGQDLVPETIELIFYGDFESSKVPMEKVILNIEGKPLEYYQFIREPGRFYKVDATKPFGRRLVRDFQIYLSP